MNSILLTLASVALPVYAASYTDASRDVVGLSNRIYPTSPAQNCVCRKDRELLELVSRGMFILCSLLNSGD
jgi:hypothetical protein